MMWSQALYNGTEFEWGIRCLSLFNKTTVRPYMVCESDEIESPSLTHQVLKISRLYPKRHPTTTHILLLMVVFSHWLLISTPTKLQQNNHCVPTPQTAPPRCSNIKSIPSVFGVLGITLNLQCFFYFPCIMIAT